MSYQMTIGAKHRGCILILVDQSYSMSSQFVGAQTTRMAETARALNRCVQEIALSCQSGDVFKDRCDIGVIGYGARVGPALAGALAGRELTSVVGVANNPARVEQVKRKMPDGAGGLIEVDYPMPIWIEEQANGGTPMAEALSLAARWLERWCRENSSSFPPVVINITDGEPNVMEEAKAAASRLVNTGTSDGQTLLFNVHISGSGSGPVVTPNSSAGLPNANAEFLYDISSVIPPNLAPAAAAEGLSSGPGARGFIFDSDVEFMIHLLRFGTTGTMGTAVTEYTNESNFHR